MYYYPVSAVLTECLILSVVEQQDSYGYEISQTVKIVADIKESTLSHSLVETVILANGINSRYAQTTCRS